MYRSVAVRTRVCVAHVLFPARNLIDIDQGRARPSERYLVRRKAVVVVVTGLSPFLAAG